MRISKRDGPHYRNLTCMADTGCLGTFLIFVSNLED